MEKFLPELVIMLLIIVVIGYVNEKALHMTYEISLLLFSVCIGVVFLLVLMNMQGKTAADVVSELHFVNIEDFLTHGFLCFMLFSGCHNMKLRSFEKHARIVTLLSIGATLLGAIFYGLLFFGASKLIGLSLSLPLCLMFGAITAPTDPIAATSILNKFHLPSSISFIMQGESLLNDGVGVAVFVCFSAMVKATKSQGFFVVFFRELGGAIVVGLLVTAICFPLFIRTTEEFRRVFISLLAVSAAYVLCEVFNFSGCIASVVCGVMFSTMRDRAIANGRQLDLQKFDDFWEMLDVLLNSLLYVMLGMSFLRILSMPHVILLSVIAICCNLIGRYCSVGSMTWFAGKLPDGYNKRNFTSLFTWGGLRGGLCIALAMSTSSMLSADTYHIIIGCTYAIVFFTTVIQGLTMPPVYRRIDKSVKKKAALKS